MAEQAKQKGKGAQEDTFVLVERVTSPFLVLFHKPHSLLAEQYRALRNNILAMNRSGSPRTILVTSAMAGEGKTVTLANLGLAMGEVERNRVLLVDADIRHPGLEAFLGLNWRFKAPVKIGDTVRVEFRVKEKKESKYQFRLNTGHNLKNG